jgi:hypothetical protein
LGGARAHGDVSVATEDTLIRIGFIVEPNNERVLCRARDILCCAIGRLSERIKFGAGSTQHFVIELRVSGVEVRDRSHVVCVVQVWNDIGERPMLHAAERVPVNGENWEMRAWRGGKYAPACDEADHFYLRETLAGKGRDV